MEGKEEEEEEEIRLLATRSSEIPTSRLQQRDLSQRDIRKELGLAEVFNSPLIFVLPSLDSKGLGSIHHL